MQKLYNLVKVSALMLLLLIQNSLQAQNNCLDCQADVKVITDKQVLLDKIEIKEGIATKLNTNLYVSYRSGNTQKFWANLAIATAGVAVSTQLKNNSSVEGNNANGISPLIPLSVSVATIPSIWKNRPRGVPQAGLWLQHRDTRGRLTDTWEQPMSSEAKNSGELLSVNIDKPLSAGTVEVYLQNGSNNPVYYWGYGSSKSIVEKIAILPKTPPIANLVGCPAGYLPNGNGMCCDFFTGSCIPEPSGDENPAPNPTPTPTPTPTPQGCPTGYLSNGQGMCCNPFTGECVNEGGSGGNNGNPTSPPIPQGCPDGYFSNGQGMCCSPITGQCVVAGSISYTETEITTVTRLIPVVISSGGCPAGYLPNGRGLCCMPTSDACIPEMPSTPRTENVPKFCTAYYSRVWTVWTGWGGWTYIGEDCSGTGGNLGNTGTNISAGDPGTGRQNGGGGGGSGGNSDPSRIQINGVTNPCLKVAAQKIVDLIKPRTSDNGKNDIDKNFFSLLNDAFNKEGGTKLIFKDMPSVIGKDQVTGQDVEVFAQCQTLVRATNTIEIYLNTSMLPGTDSEFKLATLLHEAMHAYMQVKGYASPLHSEMAGPTFLLPLVRAVQEVTQLSGRDAFGLALYGMGGIESINSGNYLNALVSYTEPELTKEQVKTIGRSYSNATYNVSENKWDEKGSGNCQ